MPDVALAMCFRCKTDSADDHHSSVNVPALFRLGSRKRGPYISDGGAGGPRPTLNHLLRSEEFVP